MNDMNNKQGAFPAGNSGTSKVGDYSAESAGAPRRRRSTKPAHAAKPAQNADSFTMRDALVFCGIPVLVVLLIRLLLVGCYTIPSRSMESTIEPGDRVLTTKLTPKIFNLKRGDVVVFHDPANWLAGESDGTLGEDYLIKRLIGLPGDVVECKGNGSPVTVNGVAIDETPYIKAGVQPSSFPFKVTVSQGHIFVMGDNRSNSADSRYHQDDGDNGLVPVNKVVGVALVRYWPLSRLSMIGGHHDVFRDVPEGTAA